ncbi:Glutathione S-transferase [Cordyceps militaris]|uniref:Glutathione S-transferase n=1 Tax=Cordyceps militaris TaxID=73501 RepID=A0A2H4STZ1_CORMI|nr:Glutathione S-transferase [Cordyceps militaris]
MATVDTSLPPEPSGAAAGLAAQHADAHPLKLYGGWFCPFVQRSWIVLEEKKIPYQYIEINPYKKAESFLAMNPRGLVPTLAVPAGPQESARKPLFESNIISEYLDEEYGDESKHGPRLMPKDAYEKARARLWIDHISNKIIPAFYKLLQHTDEKPITLDEARKEFHKHILALTDQMDSEGPFFAGKELTMVDVCLAPWAKRFWLIDHYKSGGVGIPSQGQSKEWGRWREWFKAISERKSVKDTWSADERYLVAYKRYADDTTNSEVGQATRQGKKLP